MARLRARSPLDGRCFAGKAIQIVESKAFGLVQLKGHQLATDGLNDIGPDAPPLTFAGKVIWIGPNERLLFDSQSSGFLLAHLDASSPKGYFTRNATSGLLAIEVRGECTARLLQSETGAVDFAPGFASRIRIADLAIVVWVPAPEHALCLVERSAARWLFDWFEDRASALNL